jgi:hypothetical protein
MSTLVDLKFAALRSQGFTGSMSDMTLQWLQAGGATSGAIRDAWAEFLALQLGGSETGSFVDDWFAYLGSLGYVGSLRDREYQFWFDGGSASPTEITFVGVGVTGKASESGGTSATIPIDTQEDDILLLHLCTGRGTWSMPTLPEGWEEIATVVGSSNLMRRQTVYWKRAVADEPSAVSVPASGWWTMATITAWRGCAKNSSPINAFDTRLDTGANKSCLAPSVTTSLDGCMIVPSICIGNTAAIGDFDSGNLVDITMLDQWNSNGGYTGCRVGYGILETAGASGSFAVSIGSNTYEANVTVALRP